MSFSNNYSWGTQTNESSNNKRHDASNINNWPQFGANTQGSWQQQNVRASPQPNYAQQYANWNSSQKSASPQMNYKGDGNYSWNKVPDQFHYMQQQQQQQYQQPLQTQFTSNSKQFFDNTSNTSQSYKADQMSYNTASATEQDPWNWGWDEPNNVSSYPTNNNVVHDSSSNCIIEETVKEQTYNPVQNYFQQRSNLAGMQPPHIGMQFDSPAGFCSNEANTQISSAHHPEYSDQKYRERQGFSEDRVSNAMPSKAEMKNSNDAHTVEFSNNDAEPTFEVKLESVQSFQDVSLSSEPKTERLSSDSNKIPLTTQALRDFCNEKYENGSADAKTQNNAEGLTPQWSIESQMSQETVSDDTPSAALDGSHSDYSAWDASGHQHMNQNARETNLSNSPKPSNPKELGNKSQGLGRLKQEDEASSARNTEPNQQLSTGGNFLPPPPVSGRSGDNAENNPYSLGNKFSNKGSQNKNVHHRQMVENISGNGFNKLAKQMGKLNVSDDNLNQQVIGNNLYGGAVNSGQLQQKLDAWYGTGASTGEELPNQETIPDNEERPDAEELGMYGRDSGGKFSAFKSESSRAQQPKSLPQFTTTSENQEITLRPDRNQYLETGQLEDQMESDSANNDNDLAAASLPPPGLSRHVPGEIQPNSLNNVQSSSIDISSPPPGLDRMVLGQITESEPGSNPNIFRHGQNTPPPAFHRMVPGQLNDDQNQNVPEDTQNMLSPNARRDDIPPPGFHRMIPGESSSPETQNVKQMPIDPIERRVVTGVAKEEMQMNPLQATIPSPSPTPANRLTNQPPSSEESRLQFQSERCETIGSDNVENYGATSGDVGSAKLGKRKEGKERERHREEVSSDETEREPGRRHGRDSEYYGKRERNREREDSSGERYREEGERRSKGRERVDWGERERRKNSPGRYREDRGRRRDYREERRRHKDSYDYSEDEDEDRDTNGYYSDRERRRYRDDYDRGYSRREDRARSLRPDKSSKDSNEERGSGKNRRHGGYGDRERDVERDRDREKDRERERERERMRGKERDRNSDYYRRRDDLDDFRDSQRSRPSSRNDSVQDYKHRSGRSDYDEDREKDKSHYRGHSKRDRDLFYAPGYNYDPAYYSYYYQYYENLRRTNPVAYAEWFRKYYAQSQQGTFDGTYTEDRGSVHSGRSSANDESKDRYIKTEAVLDFGYPSYQSLIADQSYPYRSHSSDAGEHETGRRLDSSLQMESVQRLTPAKFTTAHVKGSLTPRGQLVKILAHYPLDGQPATLEIHENLSCFDDLRKELLNFPGPLVKGVTHKNNILRYCKQKIKDADSNPELFDKESYKLIWELLILLIRQNGTVVGTDIAELLMSNRSSRVSRQQTPPSASAAGETTNESGLSEEEVTNQFRDYLIYGNTKEALEWAMKHGLWGHALFLASKMDQRTYASVMTRFANGLTMNDPLQTLYQLMSGRQPASVTCCADEKWGDWRPHLAMILSNSTPRPDLDVKAVTTLGDTLGSRGNLHASHFCYLMAQVEFGTFAHKSSKIVLIGSSHALPFQQFANNEAIFATEIFEFACSLADPDFALHHLQAYKLLMAKRLTEVGLVQEAVHYAEVIANTIAKFPAQYPPYFIQEVYNLGNMLKYFDPVYNNSEGAVSDPEWLLQLLNVLNDYQTGVLQHDGYGSVSNLTTYSENEGVQNLPLDTTAQEASNDAQAWQGQQQMYYEQQGGQTWSQNGQSNYPVQPANNAGFLSVEQPTTTPSSADSANRPYWSNQNQWMHPQASQESTDLQQTKDKEYLSAVGVDAYDGNQNHSLYNYYDSNKNENQSQQAPLPGTVTLPNHRQRTVSQSLEERNAAAQSKPKPAKKEPSKHNQSTGSWFGGIWNKLPFRPKNQMILPDDKNPSIVWDSDKNRWVNLNSDEDDTGGSVPPPPKASELPGSIPTPASTALATASPFTPNPVQQPLDTSDRVDAPSTPSLPPSGPNKYKMARGKSLRSNYVDVLNPGASKSPAAPVPGPEIFPTMTYSSQLPTSYFIPAPVEGNENAPVDFLSPSNAPVMARGSDGDPSQPQQALSRWSSTSSLSREVQKYTMKHGGNAKVRTQGALNPGEDYYNNKGNNQQWSGGGANAQRYPPGQSSSLPRSRAYAK